MLENRKIPWVDMFGFYLLLPFMLGFVGWGCHVIYQEEGRMGFLFAQWFFYLFTWFLLCSSIGVFVTRLVAKMEKAVGNALHETWDEMVDMMIEAQSSR